MILSMLRAFNSVKQCQAKVTRTRSNPRSLHRNPSYFVWCFIQNHQNDICRSFYCTQTEGHRPGHLSAVFGNRQSLHPCWQVLCRVARLWLWVIVLGERNPSEVHECFQPSTVFASVSRYSNGRGWSNVLTCRDMSWHVVTCRGRGRWLPTCVQCRALGAQRPCFGQRPEVPRRFSTSSLPISEKYKRNRC